MGHAVFRAGAGPLQSVGNQNVERSSETELARELITGSPEAFDRFVEHFRAKIFNFSWLMCGQREDAEEVAQDTLLSVFSNLDQLREPARIRPWVFQIAKNACLMKRRRSIFAPTQEVSLDGLQGGPGKDGEPLRLQVADQADLPEDKVLQAEMRKMVERAISELPPIYRSVMLLRDIEELSTQETSAILDLSEDTVKTRLRRARVALRQKLDRYVRNSRTVAAEPASKE